MIDTDASQTCETKETSLNWNQTGPQGQAGPQGLAGFSSLAYVSSGLVTIAAGQEDPAQAICPAGQYAVGGGVNANPGDQVFSTFPSKADPTGTNIIEPGNTAWTAEVFNPDPFDTTIEVFAVCAPAESVTGP